MDEQAKAALYLVKTGVIFAIALAVCMLGAWAADDWLSNGQAGWAERTQDLIGMAFTAPEYLFRLYKEWALMEWQAYGRPPIPMMAGGAVALGVGLFVAMENPYSFKNTDYGDSRKANASDIGRFYDENGFLCSQGVVLGYIGGIKVPWPRKLFKKKRRPERYGGNLLRTGFFLALIPAALAVTPMAGVYAVTLLWMASVVFLTAALLAFRYQLDYRVAFPRYVRHSSPEAALSMLLTAPPGGGKTAGFAIPTILSHDKSSMVIHDIKGELYEKTAGYRKTIGPVVRMAWSDALGACFNFISPTHALPGSKRYRVLKPKLNELLNNHYESPAEAARNLSIHIREYSNWQDRITKTDGQTLGNLSSPMADEDIKELIVTAAELDEIDAKRDGYVAILWQNLIPKRPDAGANEHFDIAGRNVGITGTNFMICRCERLSAERGEVVEPHLGRLIDMINEDAAAIEEYYQSEGKNPPKDILSEVFNWWERECQTYGYPKKVESDIQSLKKKQGEEFSSVISTMETKLAIFRRSTVRARTSTSTFGLDALRGVRGPDGVMRPFTLYVEVPQEEQEAFGPVTAMFFQVAIQRILSDGPPENDQFEVGMLIDECPQMPKIEAILNGPALARSYLMWFMIIGQGLSQFESTYGRTGKSTLLDTTSIKLVPAQMDMEAAKLYSEMCGDETVQTVNKNERSQGKTILDVSSRDRSWQHRGKKLYSPADITSMKPWRHLILVQGHTKTPAEVHTCAWFRDFTMVKKVTKYKMPPKEETTGIFPANENREDSGDNKDGVATPQAAAE